MVSASACAVPGAWPQPAARVPTMRLTVRTRLVGVSMVSLAAAMAIAVVAIWSLDRLLVAAGADSAATRAQALAIYDQARLLIIVMFVAAAAVGLAVAVVAARSIRNGVAAVRAALESMTDNCATSLEGGMSAFAGSDLSVEVVSVTAPIDKYGSDEIGGLAATANRMLARLKSTIEGYEKARSGLADTVGQVKAAAEGLARASDQLNATATQSGTASAQVAMTISQVAVGASHQARSASQTSAASHNLSDIIERVGEGAASTGIRVQEASRALGATTQAIGRAVADSSTMSALGERVKHALAAGETAVGETASGMTRIKSSVEATAVKVTELGAKGDQIGAIVETIDDIAVADKPAGAERGDRGGPGRRAGQGLCRRRRRGSKAR